MVKKTIYIAFLVLLSIKVTPALAEQLSIDLRTDYAYSADFRSIRVSVLDQKNHRNQWVTFFTSDGDFVNGVRVADFYELKANRNYIVSTELLDHQMRTVDGSLTIIAMESGRNGMTVLVTKPD